jgi:predicted dehydrogenase
VAQQTSSSFSGPNVWNSRIEFEDQSTLDVKVAWLLPELPPSTVTVNGSDGRLDFNCITGRGHLEQGGVEQLLTLAPLAPHWERQYQTFASAIDRGYAKLATVGDGVRALEVTAACELSAKTGLAVTPESLAAAYGMASGALRTPRMTPLPTGPERTVEAR